MPFVISPVIQKAVPVQMRAIGNVRTKAGGELTGVRSTEGQDLREGELLFTIDPRPCEAALKQAEANHQRDFAQEKHAEEDARR